MSLIIIWLVKYQFLGMYPQTVVPSTDILHTTLTNGMDVAGSGVTKLEGVYYTANKDWQGWNPSNPSGTQELNEVYSYKGDRYVRVTPYRYSADETSTYSYSTGEKIERTGNRWFKVEPIKWIILNINGSTSTVDGQGIVTDLSLFGSSSTTLELYAADVLVGGIPFGVENHTSWEGSLINRYLNEVFLNEALPMTDIADSTIYNNRKGSGTISDYTLPQYNSSLTHYPNGGQNETTQKIYLLSWYELSNESSPYSNNGNKIFDATTGVSSTRTVPGTDYARAHNLMLAISEQNTYSYYWTRTAYDNTWVYRVTHTGGIGNYTAPTAYYGTRPALPFK